MSWNGGGRHAVFTYNKINGEHPTEKPLALVSELITLFSNPGDLIFDPFMGSGTTLRAAKNLGRRCIGCEVDEKWAEVAARKLQQEVLFAEVV
jgi:site-specific DNA-methyltransferase (adenine-specific)